MTKREYYSLSIGIVVFVCLAMLLDTLFSLSLYPNIFFSLIVALEVGWYVHNPTYWKTCHTEPVRKVWDEFWDLMFGEANGQQAIGISIAMWVGSIFFFSWFVSKVGIHVNEAALVYVNIFRADEVSLVAGLTTSATILMSLVPGIYWLVNVNKKDEAKQARVAAVRITLYALLTGLLAPVAGLLAIMSLTAIVIGLGLAIVLLSVDGFASLAAAKHLTCVTVGIIVGSLVSVWIGGVEKEIASVMPRLAGGLAVGWLTGEVVHRVSPYIQSLNLDKTVRRGATFILPKSEQRT